MSLWHTGQPVIENGEVIDGGMFAHQRKWWSSEQFIKALVGGYGSGKTLIGSKRAIANALANAPVPFMAVSPSYKMAKKTTVLTIEELLDGKRIRYKYNKSEHEFLIKHEGRTAKIWIGSGDDPGSLKGPNLCSAWIDEPFLQDEEVFKQMTARIRDPRARYKELLLTGTPEELNWGYDICEGDKARPDLELIQASTYDNLALGEEYAAGMCLGFDEQAIKAFLNGQFVPLSTGTVYRAFSTDNEIDDAGDIPNELIIGVDFNVDFMSVVLCFEDEDGELIQFDEFQVKGSDTAGAMKELIVRQPEATFDVYPDSTGGSRSTKGTTDFAIIRDALGDRLTSLNYPSKNPPLRDRFNAVNAKCKNAKGQVGYRITKNCTETIKDLKLITHPYDKYKKKNEPKGRVHLSDGLGYIIHRRYPVGGKPRITIS